MMLDGLRNFFFGLRELFCHWCRVFLSIGPIGIVLGVFLALLAHHLLGVQENIAERWIFAPVAVLFAPLCMAVLPRALNKSRMEVCFLIRSWSICISLSLVAGIFLGAIITGASCIFFDLEMETAFFWIAFPFLLASIPFGFLTLAKHLRKAGII